MDLGHDGPGNGCARGVGLQAAAVATATDAPSRDDWHMAELARCAGQAGVHMPILDDAAADAGADEGTNEVVVATPGAIVEFADGRDLDIVAHGDWLAK